MSVKNSCGICGAAGMAPCYEGVVRVGKPGNVSKCKCTVWICPACCAGWLDSGAVDYESDEYRTLVDGSADVEDFYRRHDGEQLEKLKVVGTEELRGKIVVDIGCGAGSFLDLVKGYAAETIAVEPTKSFHPVLKQKGHVVFDYAESVSPAIKGKVDLAVCFSVLEHIENPVSFLKGIRELLKPGGKLLLSTPNHQDWLLELLPQDYGAFFYRYVHRWYFNGDSLKHLAGACGFPGVDVRFVHRFDVSNLLLWMKDRRPCGLGRLQIPAGFESGLAPALENAGRADYIYAWFRT